MVTKSMQSGSHAATYGYRYGDKLNEYVSSFPDESVSGGWNVYDGFGRRRYSHTQQGGITKTVWWRYAGWSPVSEHEENPDPNNDWVVGARTRTYVPGLAQIPGGNPSTGAYQYFQTDHLGSVRSVRAQDKSSLASYEYSPYGEPYHFNGPTANVGYTGHLWDPAMAMYWAPYRYYMPGNARWNMQDPIRMADSANMYSYVGDNPILFTDETGLFLLPGAILGGITGAVLGFLDQTGCSGKSKFASAALGFGLGFVTGGFPVGPISGILIGAGAGAIDAVIRGGDVISGVISGAIGGGIGGVLGTTNNTVLEAVGGIAAGSWIGNGPRFVDAVGGHGPSNMNCLL